MITTCTKGGKKDNKKIVNYLHSPLVFSMESTTLSSFGCAEKNAEVVSLRWRRWVRMYSIGIRLVDYLVLSAGMKMKARGKQQCTIVRFVLGLQRSFDKTRQPMAMATLLPVSSASAKAPPRPNLVMSIRNIELMFVNSQLCKTWSTPLGKKHSVAAYSAWLGVLHKPLQPFDRLQLLVQLFFYFLLSHPPTPKELRLGSEKLFIVSQCHSNEKI